MAETTTKTTRQKILETARFLFNIKGYPDTSMREIARQADIQASSIYAHFASKEGLLKAICETIADQFFSIPEKTEATNGTAAEKLRQLITEHVTVIANNLNAAGVFIYEWKYMSKEHVQEFIKMRNDYEHYIRNLVREGKVEGLFKDVDEKLTTLMILSALNWTYNWYKPEGKFSPEEIGERMSELLLTGLLKT